MSKRKPGNLALFTQHYPFGRLVGAVNASWNQLIIRNALEVKPTDFMAFLGFNLRHYHRQLLKQCLQHSKHSKERRAEARRLVNLRFYRNHMATLLATVESQQRRNSGCQSNTSSSSSSRTATAACSPS